MPGVLRLRKETEEKEAELNIQECLADLEDRVETAQRFKQDSLRFTSSKIHVKFNSKVQDRLENKQVDDNIKVIKSYGDYVTRTHKLQ